MGLDSVSVETFIKINLNVQQEATFEHWLFRISAMLVIIRVKELELHLLEVTRV